MKKSVAVFSGCLGVVALVPTARAFVQVEPPPQIIEASFLQSSFGINGLTFGVKASASFPELAIEQVKSTGAKIGVPVLSPTSGLSYDISAAAELFPNSPSEHAKGNASAKYIVGDGTHPDSFNFTFSGDLKTLTVPPPDLLASSALVNLTFSLSGRVRGTGDGAPDAHIAVPLPRLSLANLPPGASELASAFVKIYDKNSNLTDMIDLSGLKSANGLFDLRLDAGQLFYYEATYSMAIEDKVDPPFTFTMGGTAGVYAPAPPPVPVPEVSLLSVPVMGALAGGLIWRRRKKA